VRAFVAAGAETIICPVLRLVPVDGPARAALERALRAFVEGGEGWLGLTSASVPMVLARVFAADPWLRERCASRLRVAAVGEATVRATWSRGIAVTIEAGGEGPEALAREILAEDPRPRLLYVTSDRGLSGDLGEIERAGGEVQRAVAVEYRPEPLLEAARLLRPAAAELVVLASASAAKGLLGACAPAERLAVRALPILAVGEATAAAIRALDFEDVTVATIDAPSAIVAAAILRLAAPDEG
jgi:uroporphyrinogen-III synthase